MPCQGDGWYTNLNPSISAELSQILCPCIHAQAAQEQYRQQMETWLEMLDQRQLYTVVKAEHVMCPASGSNNHEQQQAQAQQTQGRRQQQQQQVSSQPLFMLDEEAVLMSYVIDGRRLAANVTEQGFLHCCSCPAESALSCMHVKALREYMRTDAIAQEVFAGAVLAEEAAGDSHQRDPTANRPSVSQYTISMSPHEMFQARAMTGTF